MVIALFVGKIDAYWWVFCTEEYFKHWLLEVEKMMWFQLQWKARLSHG